MCDFYSQNNYGKLNLNEYDAGYYFVVDDVIVSGNHLLLTFIAYLSIFFAVRFVKGLQTVHFLTMYQPNLFNKRRIFK